MSSPPTTTIKSETDPHSPSSETTPTATPNPLLRATNPLVTSLEQEVLDEYARLLGNVNKLSDKLADLAGSPTSMTLDGLRHLERKTATVCTLLKASVYSIVLQQQIFNEEEQQQQQQEEEGQREGGGEYGGYGGYGGYEGESYAQY
ncbi:hypothetical protein BO94DRAFT_620187 [Aspergillus sclerotioniger CBS 115572]|uniref:DASH complex subunit DAD3 n=1 Tax=Aspergillus sclerotioniger CBS 115572 TaxID=1450535 RepID=A0A317XBV3_9EURO|nr:hypothetical protein BO94DRAFT_620187 [Aspergillus sclerotioniger CBS 115572]PWY95815.1 hypothetical protein BO94DRAFT_620187 [Aspergillus sclerotioniger CBS 115572]